MFASSPDARAAGTSMRDMAETDTPGFDAAFPRRSHTMAVTIGINGFGRIGRYLVRLASCDPDIDLAVINTQADNAQLAHLLKYDSVHGRFAAPVEPCETGLCINGHTVRITRCIAGEWRWAQYGLPHGGGNHGQIRGPGILQQASALRGAQGHHQRPGKKRRHHHRHGCQ